MVGGVERVDGDIVEMGVAVRMAALYLLIGGGEDEDEAAG